MPLRGSTRAGSGQACALRSIDTTTSQPGRMQQMRIQQ
jgi:hypothetical protein